MLINRLKHCLGTYYGRTVVSYFIIITSIVVFYAAFILFLKYIVNK